MGSDGGRMHSLAMLSRPLLPGGDGAFIETESGHDGLQRTAPPQQGQHQDDSGLSGLETIERRSLTPREALFAGGAAPAITQAVMHADVTGILDAS